MLLDKKNNKGNLVYLTKNGYGSMVVLNLQQYAYLTHDLELKLDEGDIISKISSVLYEHKDVFSGLKNRVKHNKFSIYF
jgi:PHD/YefM family antitoxin component YafN of YafNO toxin-antitoxin module